MAKDRDAVRARFEEAVSIINPRRQRHCLACDGPEFDPQGRTSINNLCWKIYLVKPSIPPKFICCVDSVDSVDSDSSVGWVI